VLFDTMFNHSPYHELLEACRRCPPRVAVILGSGLGDLAGPFNSEFTVPFGEVPEMEPTTVEGHKGELRLGTWAGQRVLIFAGRLHYYEGHSWRRVEQPVAMAHTLGAQILFLTNAAGGIRPDLGPGSLMPIRAHLEWTRRFPWCQADPDTSSPYAQRLLRLINRAAENMGLTLVPGVYTQVTGPCYETPAEIRALRSCGADVVGMSTCREINRGHALGMECAALSCVTNRAAGLADGPIHHDEVVAAGRRIRDRLSQVVDGFLRLL
jgi:purine-nucleoside phosphorylase